MPINVDNIIIMPMIKANFNIIIPKNISIDGINILFISFIALLFIIDQFQY